MTKCVIIEDDPIISDSIKQYLVKWDYEVKLIDDFDHLSDEVAVFNPDIILMDINLPRYDGFHYTQEIRQVSAVPIIFISSAADDMNLVMALSVGGDDFIAKPFKLVVLKAKMDALLRRVNLSVQQHQVITYQQIKYDYSNDTVSYGEQTVELTKNEGRILALLFENQNKIVTREELMRSLWESEAFVDENTLSVNINRLRKKLSDLGIEELIQTRKGKGYLV